MSTVPITVTEGDTVALSVQVTGNISDVYEVSTLVSGPPGKFDFVYVRTCPYISETSFIPDTINVYMHSHVVYLLQDSSLIRTLLNVSALRSFTIVPIVLPGFN